VQEQLDAIASVLDASNGYTTAQDSQREPPTRPFYRKAAEQGSFFIDFVGYVNWLACPELVQTQAEPFTAAPVC
jgi:hypothetical protein